MPANDAPLAINQSKLAMFQKCPEQYRRRYVENDIVPPPFAFIRGTAVHKGAEHNFSQKVESFVDLPRGEIIDKAVTTAQEKIANEGIALAEGETREVVINEGEKQIVRLAGLYADEVAPSYQPIAVEQKIEAVFEGRGARRDIALHGTLDVIAHFANDKENRAPIIPDLKTKSKRGTQDEYDRSLQATMYAMLYRTHFHASAAAVVFEELVDKKVPERVTFMTNRGDDDFNALLRTVEAVSDSIRAGAFPGAYGQFGAWWCSKESCGYWRTCPFVPKNKR